MRPSRLLAAIVCSGLVLAACGGDDGGADEGGGLTEAEQAYADAWAGTLSDEQDSKPAVDADEAACMGDAIMAELGVAPFEEAGVEPDDIDAAGSDDDSPGELLGTGVVTDAQAEAVLDVWEDCADLPALLAATIVADLELDAEGEACLVEGFADGDLVREGYINSFVADDDEPPADLLADLLAVVDGCTAGGEDGSALVRSMAESLAADGSLTEEQATCVAEVIVDTIGQDRLIELTSGGDFDSAPPEVQAEITDALMGAASDCDVPVSAFEG